MTTIPHDLTAETGLLGSLLMFPSNIDHVRDWVTPSDFYKPGHAALFAVLAEVRDRGESPALPVLLHELHGAMSADDLLTVQVAGSGEYRSLARLVARQATARKLISAAAEITTQARTDTLDADELIAFAAGVLAEIDSPTQTGDVQGLSTIDEFLNVEQAKPTPWVIPGLLREGWRAMVVGSEGVGKMVALRQIAIAAAQGVHPFSFAAIRPIRALIVDLENPPDAISETAQPITDAARAHGNYDEYRAWIWHRPGGINIRTRAARRELEQVISAVLPDVVCLGPVYKAYRATARESDELAAGEVQAVFDELRVRYKFALVLEHHAPKASGGIRDLLPYGSSLWLRWPELGIKLTSNPDGAPKGSVAVKHWRQARMKHGWPDELHRSETSPWPWVGYWQSGMAQPGAATRHNPAQKADRP